MIVSLLIEVFIKAFLLLILLYIVARDEADFEFRKVTMVTAGIVLGAVILDATLTRMIGLLTLIPIAAFIVFMVMQFCWVRFWRSLLVAIPFLILNVMISTAVTGFNQKADAAIARGLQGPVSEEDMKIALSMYQDGGRTNEFIAAALARKNEPPPMKNTIDHILLQTVLNFFSSNKPPFKPVLAGKAAGLPPPRGGAPKPGEPEIKTFRPEIHIGKQAAAAPEWQAAAKKIGLRGTLIGKDGVRVAIVNDQMFKENECIQVEHKKMIYRWRVRFIRDGGISWEPVEAVKK